MFNIIFGSTKNCFGSFLIDFLFSLNVSDNDPMQSLALINIDSSLFSLINSFKLCNFTLKNNEEK